MLNICTLFDKNYISKGMALIESLIEVTNYDFEIHILAIDEETFNFLKNRPKIKVYWLQQMEVEHHELQQAKTLPATLYGTQRDNYIWCLCPWFTNFILKSLLPEEILIYCDSDIFFYKNPILILEKMGEKPMAIHTHRFSCSFANYISDPKQLTGFFNVGVFAIKNNPMGMEITERWKYLCFNNTDPFHTRWGACGDQGFLTQIYIEYKDNICVFDTEGLSHIAPWTEFPTEFKDNDIVIFKGNTEPLMFSHFSHFKYDLQNGTWLDNDHGEWLPSAKPEIKAIYQRYYNTIVKIHTKYNL